MNEKNIRQVLEIEKAAQELQEKAKREAQEIPARAEQEAQALLVRARAEAQDEARKLVAAVQAEDRPLAAAVKRNTEYHLRETQPDHATSQPWGLFAFVWNESTRPLADGLLHAAQTLRPENRSDGITSMLLADALYCLRLFDGPPVG